ncbi:MAG: LacI family DNA-binding transcriptional regulator [Lachnospiraceae bacterium]|nr:LacI family DNA-binding transcriptional regulator [Lachnospiraceae bacterium]
MVTLKDIAKEAGVSVMTVSRVVNQRYSEVSEENIAKIQEIIKKLGYIPNSSARSLSSKSSRIISVIINGTHNPLSSPYNALMLGQIVLGVQERGYNTMVHFTDEYSEVTKHLHSWKAEGAIFLGTFEESIRQIQEDNKIPLIFTDSYTTIRQVNNIGIDDYKGGVLAAEHFIKNGHTNFAFISPHLHMSQVIQQRLAGFEDALKKAGFGLPADCIFEPYLTAEEKIDALCSNTAVPTAVFAATDTCATETIAALKKKGYRVPEDYSVIGFDDLDICKNIEPTLTTISQNIKLKAKYVLNVLFDHLQNHDLPTQNVILDVELVERDSVAKVN